MNSEQTAQELAPESQITPESDRPWLWKPGQSGNPGGRPKRKLISEAYKDILEDEGAEAYAQVIAKDAKTAKNAADRRAAIQEMTDRVEGKAIQAHKIEVGVDDSTARALVELAARLLTTGTITIDAEQPQLSESKGVKQE